MVTQTEIKGINKLIGIADNRSVKIKSERDLTRISRAGLQRKYFKLFSMNAGFSSSDLEQFAQMPRNTIDKEDEYEILTPEATERLIEVALIFVRGIEIFGSKDNFHKWLSTENPALGRIKPQELLDNSFGIQELNDELTRIDEGIFA
jgi:putative toxin-antitoxin system antitoxin component (TIGR02293 family)